MIESDFTEEGLHLLRKKFSGIESTPALLKWALDQFGSDIAFACSFGAEDLVLLHLLGTIRKDVSVFFIDTGRLHEDTYRTAEKCSRFFGIQIRTLFPSPDAVEAMVREKGFFSFYESAENRLECCRIRKVESLARALSGKNAWITGLRREQSIARAKTEILEIDTTHGGILKVNPLVEWSEKDVYEIIERERLPMNPLLKQGYSSIGCEPCTRAIRDGEDPRAGRWWWETASGKECGLHIRGNPHK